MNTRPVRLFLAAELTLYIWFLWLDLFRGGAGSIPVKFGSIILCMLFTLGLAFWGDGDRLTAAAMVFTLGADTFLLLLNRNYEVGVLLFCVVQGLYLYRLYRASGRTLWTLRLGLLVLLLGALRLLGLLTPVNMLSLFYFSNFVCNVVLSLFSRQGWMLSLGLTLFLCCDLCVGGFNVPDLLPPALAEPVRVGMWLFYLPGQVLISLSALPDQSR